MWGRRGLEFKVGPITLVPMCVFHRPSLTTTIEDIVGENTSISKRRAVRNGKNEFHGFTSFQLIVSQLARSPW